MRQRSKLVKCETHSTPNGYLEVRTFEYEKPRNYIGVEFLDPCDIPHRDGLYWYYDLTGQDFRVGDIVSIPTYVVPSGARAIVRTVSMHSLGYIAKAKDITILLSR